MSQSVATELFDLLLVGGVGFVEEREQLAEGRMRVRQNLERPSQFLVAHRSSSGLISIPIRGTECLAITRIEAFNVDYSSPATLAIKNSTTSVAQNAQPLQTLVSEAALYVFAPGTTAIFNFVFSAAPTYTARVQVRGYILPAAAFNKLSLTATRELSF